MRRAELGLICGLLLSGAAASVFAREPVRVMVLREHAVGTSAQAQPHLDAMLSRVRSQLGWEKLEGKYLTRRSRAERYIREHHPRFAILSLPAFLKWRHSHGLEVIGQVKLSVPGGRRYFLLSKEGEGLSACRGEKLASHLLDDARFVERVVAARKWKLADFSVIETRRPLQALKKVIRGEARCALIDDAQKATLEHIEGGDQLETVWSSAELPPLPIVAFARASDADKRRFRSALGGLCGGSAARSCRKVGIVSLRPAPPAPYVRLARAYAR